MTSTQSLYIGLDLGTSGVRAITINDAGEPLADARAPLAQPERREGHSQQSAELWWAAVAKVLRQTSERVGAENVRAVAVDATSATVLAVDDRGASVGDALMYDDRRASAEAARIAQVAPAESIARGPGSGLAKALWLLQRYPQARRIVHQADWIAGRLAGRFDFSDTNNCLKTGFDARRLAWPPWMDSLIDAARLPKAFPPGTVIAPLAESVAGTLGLTPQTQVVTGTTDSTAAALAAGPAAVGQGITSLGSTLVVKLWSANPLFAPEYGVYSHRVDDAWLAGGASNSGGRVLLQYFDPAQLRSLSEAIDPTQDSGLNYYPLPAPGERFPHADPILRPRMEPRPASDARFLHGLLEGIARIERAGYERLAALGAQYPESVISMGGGATNRVWSALRARILDVPLRDPTHSEAAYGAALLARRGMKQSQR